MTFSPVCLVNLTCPIGDASRLLLLLESALEEALTRLAGGDAVVVPGPFVTTDETPLALYLFLCNNI